MSSVCPYRNICRRASCPPNIRDCGLFSFLKATNQQKQTFRNKRDLQLISDLERNYVHAWNRHATSAGKGSAMGCCFEEWIRKILKRNGIPSQKGFVGFRFGKFQVDAAIPSCKSPCTILEIKMRVDIQSALMIRGLFDQLTNPDTKIGLVTFYDYTPKRQIMNIFSSWKRRFQKRFDCFHIENGWSTEIARIVNFCLCLSSSAN